MRIDDRWLWRLMLLNVGIHVLEVGLAATVMAPCSPGTPEHARVLCLAAAPAGWTLGWAVWAGSAVLNTVWYAALVSRLRRPHTLASLAPGLAAIGAAVDGACDVVHVLGTPALAAAGAAWLPVLLVVERLAWAIGAVVANPCYTAGAVLITVLLAHEEQVRANTLRLIWAVAVGSAALMAAGLSGDPLLIQLAAGPTIVGYTLWVVLVTRDLLRETPVTRTV